MNKNILLILILTIFILIYSQTFNDYISNISIYDNNKQNINDSILINNYPDSTIDYLTNILQNSNHNYINKMIAIRILKKINKNYDSLLFNTMKEKQIENKYFLRIFENKDFLDSIVDSFYTDSNTINTFYYVSFLKNKNRVIDLKELLNRFSDNRIIRQNILRAFLKTQFKDSIEFDYFLNFYNYKDYNTQALLNQIIAQYDNILNYIDINMDSSNIRMFNNYIDICSYIDSHESYDLILNMYENANKNERIFIKYIIQKKIKNDSLFFDSIKLQNIENIIGE